MLRSLVGSEMCIRDRSCMGFIIVPAIKIVTGEQQLVQTEGQNQPFGSGRPRNRRLPQNYPSHNTAMPKSTNSNRAGKSKPSRVLGAKVLQSRRFSSGILELNRKKIQNFADIASYSRKFVENIQKNSPRRYMPVPLPIYWCLQALSRLTKWWAQNEEVPVNWH